MRDDLVPIEWDTTALMLAQQWGITKGHLMACVHMQGSFYGGYRTGPDAPQTPEQERFRILKQKVRAFIEEIESEGLMEK